MGQGKQKNVISKIFKGTAFLSLGVSLFFSISNPVFAQLRGGFSAEKALDQIEGVPGNIVSGIKDVGDFLCKNLVECGDKGEVTDFINFEGGLQAPSGEGLAPKLTEVKSATEFVVNVTNFALSFLGLAAVIAIIYGGILYVTAHGNDEQTGKAKKTIQYAIIGIFVILVSFALVNTILKFAPTGQPDTGGEGARGAAPLNAADLGKDLIYHEAALEIQANMQNMLTAYRIFAVTHEAVSRIEDLPTPSDIEEASAYAESVRNFLGAVVNQTPSLSEIHIAARRLINDVIDPAAADLRRRSRGSFLFETAYAQTGPIQHNVGPTPVNVIENQTQTNVGPTPVRASEIGDIKTTIVNALHESQLSEKNDAAFRKFLRELQGRLDEIKKALGPIAEARTAAESLPGAPDEIKRVLSGIPANFTVGQAFADAVQAVSDADSLIENPDDVSKVSETIKSLGLLRIMIRDIKFVFVKLGATVKEGNAPLAVQFDGLGSLDPSSKTIQNDKYEWDLNGNGIFNEPNEDCKEDTHLASATCIFKTVGTYRAALKITGSRPDIATGIAYLTINVNPPRSRITLTARAGQTPEILRGYDSSGKLIIDKSSYRITKTEGKNGIVFDASESTDSGGTASGLTFFEWQFGDGTDSIAGASARVIDNPKKTYAREGTFPLSLEVTDKGGIKDRKIVNVSVSNIAARINAATLRGDLSKTFEFDGSRSKSEIGPIRNYAWTITDQDGRELPDVENNEGETFRYQFHSPGKFQVKLTVTDGASNQDSAQVAVVVESQAPKAVMDIRGCFDPQAPCLSKSDPSLIELDATRSFDPDPGDQISYQWEIVGETRDVDFVVVEGERPGTPWDKTPKVKVRFLKKGEYTVRLRVEDQHTDQDLRKSDTAEQKINIASAISALFDASTETAKTIAEGATGAAFEMKINIANIADPQTAQFEIDYGDSKSDSFPPFPQGVNFQYDANTRSGQLTLGHTYEEAGSYLVKVRVLAAEGETDIQKQLTVVSGENPFALIEVKKNNVEEIPGEGEMLQGNRSDVFTFDGSASLNSDGSHRNLKYSWDFGDGSKNDRPQATHKFEDISPQDPGYFTVKLTVFDSREIQKRNTATFKIKIIGEKPVVQTLTVVRKGAAEVTPVQVEVTAEGAKDPDGQIQEYTFWYFDPADKDRKLGVIHVPFNRTTLTVETYGLADETRKYLFCVEVKDNENNIASCDDLFAESSLPFIEVRNGPNQSPVADFTVSRTNIKVGDSVTFTSSSHDPDGRIMKYVWDFEGDGFANDTESDNPHPTHTYETKSPQGGFPVQLKVIDDRGAAGYSLPKYIFVDPLFQPPTANFECVPAGGLSVRCTNLSRAAPGSSALLQKFEWDFDTGSEFCNGGSSCTPSVCQEKPALCDSVADNDPDREEQNPQYEYRSGGAYTVRLVVTDSNDQKSQVEKTIRVSRGEAAPGAPIRASIITAPPVGPDGKLHLSGNGQSVAFRFNESAGRIDRYVLDKNIYFDSGRDRPDLFSCGDPHGMPPPGAGSVIGDGCLDNDADEESTDGIRCIDRITGQPRSNCSTNYQVSWLCNNVSWAPRDTFRSKLTVFGTDDSGRRLTDSKTLDITFDKTPACAAALGAAALFDQFGANEAIVLGILAGAVIALLIYGISLFGHSGKPRTII